MTPLLTLQGAVAHSDMPLASGPTTYLPHSHKYKPGYVAFRRDDFKLFYAEHKVLERTQAHNTHAYTRTRGVECETRRTYQCAADACCRG
jgi:ectoine hydroxylase-related dioxygenase (phytanoyl-CoA dioxygenase family)